MELWIRSQDRERITKIDEVYYSSDDYGYYVMCYKDQFTGYKLGKYKSKERALEVLDEIENLLIPKYVIRIDDNTQKVADFLNTGNEYIKAEGNGDVRNINNTFVYEMPEE